MRYPVCILLFLFCGLVSQAQTFEADSSQLYAITKTKANALWDMVKKYSKELQSEKDSTKQAILRMRIDSLNKAAEANEIDELMREFELVRRYPAHPGSLNILSFKIWRRVAEPYFEQLAALFHHLSDSLKATPKGKELGMNIYHCANSSIGKTAPVFTVPDVNGNKIALSDFRGQKFVLLDFWASWCSPCRGDFPFVKKVYDEYHSLGLEVIAISIDTDLEAWKQAIIKDDIGQWRHLSVRHNNEKIEMQYFIPAIPVKILIDKNGKIVGRWRGGGDTHKPDILRKIKELANHN